MSSPLSAQNACSLLGHSSVWGVYIHKTDTPSNKEKALDVVKVNPRGKENIADRESNFIPESSCVALPFHTAPRS